MELSSAIALQFVVEAVGVQALAAVTMQYKNLSTTDKQR